LIGDTTTQKNFVADFVQAKCDFLRKSAVLRFWDPFGSFRGNVLRSS